MDEVFITGAARTPMGGFQGALSEVPAATLGGIAIRAALDGGAVPASAVSTVTAVSGIASNAPRTVPLVSQSLIDDPSPPSAGHDVQIRLGLVPCNPAPRTVRPG